MTEPGLGAFVDFEAGGEGSFGVAVGLPVALLPMDTAIMSAASIMIVGQGHTHGSTERIAVDVQFPIPYPLPQLFQACMDFGGWGGEPISSG